MEFAFPFLPSLPPKGLILKPPWPIYGSVGKSYKSKYAESAKAIHEVDNKGGRFYLLADSGEKVAYSGRKRKRSEASAIALILHGCTIRPYATVRV